MIRFLIGCILAIVLLWMVLLTVGPFLMGFSRSHHAPVVQQQR